jgi:hypothetical protein
LIAPSAFNSAWRCSRHGQTLPLVEFHRLDETTIDHIRTHSEVPLWLPDPVPPGWLLAGLAAVGDSRSRFRATVAAFEGPAPLGGRGEWLLVAEEPGIGLGAGYARSSASTPAEPPSGPPTARMAVGGHPMPVWPVRDITPDRSAYLGEAAGVWMWFIGLPADAGYAVLEDLAISDSRAGQLDAVAPGSRIRSLRPGAD